MTTLHFVSPILVEFQCDRLIEYEEKICLLCKQGWQLDESADECYRHRAIMSHPEGRMTLNQQAETINQVKRLLGVRYQPVLAYNRHLPAEISKN